MSQMAILAVYCGLIVLASLAGGWVPILVRLTHRRLQLATSLVAGFVLGVGLLHMLPHAAAGWAGPEAVLVATGWLLGGFLVMFFLERFFCFHHHDAPEIDPLTEPAAQHAHGSCGHDHTAHPRREAGSTPAADAPGGHREGHVLSWTGVAIGLTLHSLIDGVALAAAVAAGMGHGHYWAGLAVFLAVLVHKPFDSLAVGALMARHGWSPSRRHAINLLFALVAPVGVVLFTLGLQTRGHDAGPLVAAAMAFCAGVFLCVATSDLLPELQFHHHDRLGLSLALLLGLALAAGMVLAETHSDAHKHHHATPATAPAPLNDLDHTDDHAGHGH